MSRNDPASAGALGRTLSLVSVTVLLNVAGMFVLKTMVINQPLSLLIIGVGIGSVVCMHLVRFLMWGLIHNRERLSFSYGLTSIYYLTIIPVMMYFDEAVRWQHYAGAVMITLGVAMLLQSRPAVAAG